MGDSYTVLWSNDRIRQIVQYQQEGARLEILFGGPHSSEPSFRRYGVHAGDYVYPVRVYKGVLYVIGRMKVKQLISLEQYIDQYPDTFAHCEPGRYPMETLANYLKLHPEKLYLAPSCTEEVAIGEEGTLIRLDAAIPAGLVERLRFRSQRGERGLKHVENGRLKNVISLQGGVYRLAEPSAQEVADVLMGRLQERG